MFLGKLGHGWKRYIMCKHGERYSGSVKNFNDKHSGFHDLDIDWYH